MNKILSQPPKRPDQPTPPPLNPYQPPKAALEESQPPILKKSDSENGTAPLRAALFAPAVVIGPIAGLFMIGAWGWQFVLVMATAAVGYWRHLRT